MIMLMGNQKVAPIAVWEKSASSLEGWAVFLMMFLGEYSGHPATYNIFLLIKETSGVIPRLRAQARHHPTFPAALLFLIRQDFNESF